MKLRILYHGNCFDGVSSAAVFTKFYRANVHPEAEVAYMPYHAPSGKCLRPRRIRRRRERDRRFQILPGRPPHLVVRSSSVCVPFRSGRRQFSGRHTQAKISRCKEFLHVPNSSPVSPRKNSVSTILPLQVYRMGTHHRWSVLRISGPMCRAALAGFKLDAIDRGRKRSSVHREDHPRADRKIAGRDRRKRGDPD